MHYLLLVELYTIKTFTNSGGYYEMHAKQKLIKCCDLCYKMHLNKIWIRIFPSSFESNLNFLFYNIALCWSLNFASAKMLHR